ncbi:methionine sulfoxide reductase A [Penicillium lagena]|uniref:methionine sulfoxide reductase A n=1 Tax=Penicillium lagena TaxID=94218 RepID=UPI0025410555|nr:methionine sulfoxide reductase A [Penicillium lagena]KAJ5601904.1 methionine sulfoxide reductase A [Penicillium lagena]
MSFTGTSSLLLRRFIRPFTTTTSPILLSLTGNSSSAAAAAQSSSKMSSTPQTATLAAGCFWGVEHLFRKHFGNGKGLLDAKVGYCGGKSTAPSYRAVCSGDTGHAEALQVTYDPSLVSYRQLLEFFFRMHDPTTMNRQGPDVGTQYRSAIFTHGDEQQKTAEGVAEKVAAQWFKQPLSTQIVPAGPWWDAEEYHQLYLNKNPAGYECPAHFVRNFPPLAD